MVKFGWLEDVSQGSWVQDASIYKGMGMAYNMTIEFHQKRPDYVNKGAYYAVGLPKKDEKEMLGIYFVDNHSSTGSANK